MTRCAAVEIRPFLLRHLNRVLEIERACFAPDPYPSGLFVELYRDCGPLFFVAKRSRRIVGYSVTCEEEGRAELISIAVDAAHRSTGVGTALLEHTLSELKQAGARSLVLMVRVGNDPAIRFYRGLGFRAAGKVRRYYEDGADGITMRRRV